MDLPDALARDLFLLMPGHACEGQAREQDKESPSGFRGEEMGR
jgi:hypothetical protein